MKTINRRRKELDLLETRTLPGFFFPQTAFMKPTCVCVFVWYRHLGNVLLFLDTGKEAN